LELRAYHKRIHLTILLAMLYRKTGEAKARSAQRVSL